MEEEVFSFGWVLTSLKNAILKAPSLQEPVVPDGFVGPEILEESHFVPSWPLQVKLVVGLISILALSVFFLTVLIAISTCGSCFCSSTTKTEKTKSNKKPKRGSGIFSPSFHRKPHHRDELTNSSPISTKKDADKYDEEVRAHQHDLVSSSKHKGDGFLLSSSSNEEIPKSVHHHGLLPNHSKVAQSEPLFWRSSINRAESLYPPSIRVLSNPPPSQIPHYNASIYPFNAPLQPMYGANGIRYSHHETPAQPMPQTCLFDYSAWNRNPTNTKTESMLSATPFSNRHGGIKPDLNGADALMETSIDHSLNPLPPASSSSSTLSKGCVVSNSGTTVPNTSNVIISENSYSTIVSPPTMISARVNIVESDNEDDVENHSTHQVNTLPRSSKSEDEVEIVSIKSPSMPPATTSSLSIKTSNFDFDYPITRGYSNNLTKRSSIQMKQQNSEDDYSEEDDEDEEDEEEDEDEDEDEEEDDEDDEEEDE